MTKEKLKNDIQKLCHMYQADYLAEIMEILVDMPEDKVQIVKQFIKAYKQCQKETVLFRFFFFLFKQYF